MLQENEGFRCRLSGIKGVNFTYETTLPKFPFRLNWSLPGPAVALISDIRHLSLVICLQLAYLHHLLYIPHSNIRIQSLLIFLGAEILDGLLRTGFAVPQLF
jgi:hypothetical protein